MALTPEDLQAIGALMDSKLSAALEPIKEDIADLREDIADLKEDVIQIREDTTLTRDVVNGLSEWVEVAADVLRIKYPVKE